MFRKLHKSSFAVSVFFLYNDVTFATHGLLGGTEKNSRRNPLSYPPPPNSGLHNPPSVSTTCIMFYKYYSFDTALDTHMKLWFNGIYRKFCEELFFFKYVEQYNRLIYLGLQEVLWLPLYRLYLSEIYIHKTIHNNPVQVLNCNYYLRSSVLWLYSTDS